MLQANPEGHCIYPALAVTAEVRDHHAAPVLSIQSISNFETDLRMHGTMSALLLVRKAFKRIQYNAHGNMPRAAMIKHTLQELSH